MTMADDASRSRLGRGLAALIADSSVQMPAPAAPHERRRLPIERLRANPRNPRRAFDPEELESLAASIRERGIIQPIVVRPARGAEGAYEIVAGERRWRAAQAARLTEVPVVVVEVSDKEALELAIIENVQRQDLNPMEEARGYERLSEDFGYTPADLARIIGKSRSHVANMMRLLKLPAPVEQMVSAGALTAGHARALLAFDDPEAVARTIVQRGLSVREVEKMAQRRHSPAELLPPAETRPAPEPHGPPAAALGERLGTLLGLPVAVEPQGRGGEVRIRYRSTAELEALCRHLTGRPLAG